MNLKGLDSTVALGIFIRAHFDTFIGAHFDTYRDEFVDKHPLCHTSHGV